MEIEAVYRRQNWELIKELAAHKKRLCLYEQERQQFIQNEILLQQIIRAQNSTIEMYVTQNSQALNQLLTRLYEGQQANMTVVTDFITSMSAKLQDLLVNTSAVVQTNTNRWSKCPENNLRRPSLPLTQTTTAVAAAAAAAAVEVHRSASGSPANAARGRNAEVDAVCTPTRDAAVDRLVTRRKVPSSLRRSFLELQNIEEVPTKDEMKLTPDDTSEADESRSISAEVTTPKCRVLRSRTIFQPVCGNTSRVTERRRNAARNKTTATPEKEEDEDLNCSSRPHRKAAPKTLAEPSLRRKLRQK